MALKVYVSPGHGGTDPGAVGNGLLEKDFTLKIALKLKALLTARGVQVKMARDSDISKGVSARAKEANDWGAQAVIDVHINAAFDPTGNGFEIYHSRVGGTGKTMAENMEQLVKTRFKSRGIKTKLGADGKDYFGIIRETEAPAVLAEALFISNADDAAALREDSTLQFFAECYAKGICETFGVKWETADPPPVNPSNKPLYRVQVGAFNDRANAEAMLARLKQVGFDGIIVQA